MIEIANICRICGSERGHRVLSVREMMFGLRESFLYFVCRECGCAQISQVPEDLRPYYPDRYYSLISNLDRPEGLLPRVFFRSLRLMAPIVRRFLLSQNAIVRMPRMTLARWDLRFLVLEMMSHARITKQSSILDVGCGGGFIPYCLKQAGFRRVVGVDPFIERELKYQNGLQVLKQDLLQFRDSTSERFDLVMFNHSLEHMEHHDVMLTAAADLLTPGGCILVRIPIVDCDPFVEYQEHLVGLDAPRHLIVHSQRSLEIIAKRAGLEVDQVLFDSNTQQFWASEQYRRDIPLFSERSYQCNKQGSIFTRRELREFARRAAHLNHTHRGDRAGFFLRKPSGTSQ